MYKKNFVYYISQYLVKITSFLLLNFLIFIHFGVDNYGLYSYFITLTSFSVLFLSLGMDEIIIRDIINKKFNHDEILGSSLIIKLVGFIIMIVLLFTFSRKIPFDKNLVNILKFVFLSYLFQIFSNIDLFFKSQQNYKYAVISIIVPQLIIIFLNICIIVYKFEILNLFLLLILENILIFLIRIFLYYKLGYKIQSWKISIKTIKSLIVDSYPIAINSACILLFLKLDQLMLKSYLTFKEVGEYSIVVKLSEGWYFIPMSIIGSYSPSLFKSHKKDKDDFFIKLQSLFDIFFTISIFAIVFYLFFGKYILFNFFKLYNMKIYYSLCLHIFSGLFVSFSLVWTRWVISENKQFTNVLNQFTSLLINIVLNLILIPKFGIIGAAVSTLVGVVSGTLVGITLFESKQTLIIIKNIFSVSILFRLNNLFYNKYGK